MNSDLTLSELAARCRSTGADYTLRGYDKRDLVCIIEEGLGWIEAEKLQIKIHNLRAKCGLEPLDYVIENQFVKASP